MPVLNHEFNGLVRFFGSLVPHTLSGTSYPDFAAMKADYRARGSIKINVDYSTGTVFGDPTINWLFRAWHDACHLITDGDFSREGEYKAMLEMWRQIDEYPGLDNTFWPMMGYNTVLGVTHREWFKRIVYAEVIGQFDEYAKTGHFPQEQYAFVEHYLWTIRNKSLDELR
jgi:hypothetical protein